MTDDRIAPNFLLNAIQHWGQTDEQREKATREYVEAAGLKYGNHESAEWLANVLANLQRGEFHSEVRQLQAAIDTRKTKAA